MSNNGLLNVQVGGSIDVGDAMFYIKTGQSEIASAVQEGKGELDTHTTAKIGEFNTNATNKTNDFNANYTAKKALIDAEVQTAKDWATKTDGTVDGTDYSAKYYAQSLLPISSEIVAVSAIADDVQAVGAVASDVAAVADDLTAINAVNTNKTNIDTVAGSISNVNSVGSNISKVNAVYSDLSAIEAVNNNKTNIDTVATNVSAVGNVSANMSKVSNVNNNMSHVVAVDNNKTNIDAVAGNATNINKVAVSIVKVNNVGLNISKVTAVADDLTNVDTVAGNIADVSTVAGVSSAVSAVGAIADDLDDVIDNAANITTVAENITDVAAVGENIANVNTVAGDITAINTCANNVSAINAAPTYANNSKIWAEGLDGEVAPLGGTHSSKGWAQIAEAAASGVQNPANRDLSNLTNTGQMIIDSQNGTISNCILEVPQNIKLELRGNTLTIKAGSTVVLANGTTYTTYTFTQDLSRDYSGNADGLYPVIGKSSVMYAVVPLSQCGSGEELPATNSGIYRFYNTTDKILYYNTGSAWINDNSFFPVCLLEMKDGVASFAKDSNGNDMIFNGAGFIGHHAIIYPNVKGLFANGINNGNLQSSQYNSSALQIIELATGLKNIEAFSNSLLVARYHIGEVDTVADLPNVTSYYYTAYVKSENAVYYKNTTNAWTSQIGRNLNLIDYTYNGTTVTQFDILQPYEGARNLLTDDIEEEVATKQVDVTTLTGYDSTQTQTLKNINGVLQWVTD